MKATEIQIGDWVKDKYKPEPHQVNSWADFNSSEDLFPIPITPEILKKNWFEDDKFGYFNKRFRHLCGYHYICIDLKNYTIIIGEMYCPPEDSEECQWENEIYLPTGNICVHNLQHALRLYGLDDLADNFEI